MASIPKIKLCQIGKQTIELIEIEEVEILIPSAVKKKDQDLIRSASKKNPSFLKAETVVPWSDLGIKKEDEEILSQSILFPVLKKKQEKTSSKKSTVAPSKRLRAFKTDYGKLYIDTQHLIIQYSLHANPDQIKKIYEKFGLTKVYTFSFAIGLELVHVADRFDAIDVSMQLSEDENIESAEPNFLENIGLRFTPMDANYNLQWQYHDLAGPPPLGIGVFPQKPGAHTNAEAAWDYTQGNGVSVAWVDNSFDVTHPDLNVDPILSAFFTAGPTFNSGVGAYPVPPLPAIPPPPAAPVVPVQHNHGTNCAGMIGANASNVAGGVGGAGMAIQATLVLISLQPAVATFALIARALAYAADPSLEIPGANPASGVQVMGCSLGPNSPDAPAAPLPLVMPAVLQSAIEFATRNGRGGRGVPIFWATDNGTAPISVDQVSSHSDTISLARSWQTDVHNASSFGPELDLIAPGVDVFTTDWCGAPALGSTYTNAVEVAWAASLGIPVQSDSITGCSFSAPLAAGLAALVLSNKFEPTSNYTNLLKVSNSLSWVEVKELMSTSSIPIGLEVPMTNQTARFLGGVINNWQDAGGNSILNPNGTLNANAPNTNLNGAVAAGDISLLLNTNVGYVKRQAIMVGARTTLTGGATGTGAIHVINVANSANFAIGDNISIRTLGSSFILSNIAAVSTTISIQDTTGFQAGDWVRVGIPGNFDFLQIANIQDHSVFDINPAFPIANFHSWRTNVPVVRVNAPPAPQNPITTPLIGATVTGIPNGVSLQIDNVPNNFPNARNTIVELQGTEVRAIRSVSPDGVTVIIDSLLNPHPNNCPVLGGFVPARSDSYGRGRIDALGAVLESIDYEHSQRDLVIRKSLTDDGLSTTDVTLADVNTPDVWMRNTNPVDNVFTGDAAALPATYGDFGPHQKMVLGNPAWIYSRVRNIGTLYNSLDYSVRNYLTLTDGTVPFTTQDYKHSYQAPAIGPPLGIATNSLGSHFLGQSRVYNDARFTIPAPNIQTLGGTSIAPGATQVTAVNWPAATRPTIPLPAPSAELLAITTAAGTARVHNANRFQVNQVVLIDLPGMPSYATDTITAIAGDVITFLGGLPAGRPVTTKITGLTATTTTLSAAAVAGDTINVADASAFAEGKYILLGAAGTATSEIHQIKEINYNGATHSVVLTAPIANVAAHILATVITLIQGDNRLFLLSEIRPYDGVLAGANLYDNNNVTFREVFLGHKISFLDAGPGTTALGTQTQVNNAGGLANVDFRIRIEDSANFTTENVRLSIHRIHANGTTETTSFVHQAPGGGGPAVWTLIPAGPGWANLNAPTITVGGAAAAGAQGDITFSGSYEVSNLHTQVRISCNVPGVLPAPGGPFLSTRSHAIQVFAIPGLPDGVPGNDIQNNTGTQALAGTQAIHVFADTANLEQTQALSFGIKDSNKFRLTSSFTTAAMPGVDVRAFAVLDSLVFMQYNAVDDTVNLILRPLRQARIGFTKVKYFIYRGLRAADFINGVNVRVSSGSPNGDFLDSLHQVQLDRGIAPPLPLTAIGWDPANQNDDDLLDNYFFSTNPDQQLPVVKRGMTLGRFNNVGAADEFGFEIVLAEGYYPITLGNLRTNEYILDVSSINDADKKLVKREEILNYIDPCAYYGMHYFSDVESPDPANVDPNVIQTLSIRELPLYNAVVSQFFTKNTLYIDIRNENGNSYNYHKNYNFQGAGADNGMSIRNGNTPPDINPLVARLYKTQSWPILVQDVSADPVTSDNDFNTAFLQMVKNDNGDPMLYMEYGYAITPTSNNSNYFITGTELQNQSVVDAIAGDVITVRDALVGTINIGDIVHLSMNEHKSSNKGYTILAIATNGGNPLFTDLTMQVGTVDPAAAAAPAASRGNIAYGDWLNPIGFAYPNIEDPGNAAKRQDVSYLLKLRYCRRINPFTADVVGINQATKLITVRGNIQNQLFAGQSILLRGADLPIGGISNNANYTIANGGIALAGANTTITVIETIPQPFVGPGSDGEIVVDPKAVVKSSRYFDNIFGPLSSMIRSLNITAITVNGANSSTITVAGNYLTMLPVGSSIAIIESANNNGRYNISNSVINAGNTEITIDTPSALNGTLDGKISIVYSIWDSTKPTKWITGFDKRFLDMTNDPERIPTRSLHNFSYLGQTGIAVENQRAIFYMTPLDFFEAPTDETSLEVVNMNGGLSDKDSFWQAMQFQNQGLHLNTTLLRINPGGGEILIPVFDFEDDAFVGTSDIKKENFLALCLTKAELTILADLAHANFDDINNVHFVLRNEDPEFDLNFESYRKYDLRLSGHKKNFNAEWVATEVAPASPIHVYTLDTDRVIFSSEDFANLEALDNELDNYEEEFRLRTEALDILADNLPLQIIVDDFHTDLNNIGKDLTAILALIEVYGQLIWQEAVTQADTGGFRPYDDRCLYWARLHMRASIKNHSYLKRQRRRRRRALDLLEQHSRGLQTVDFAPGAGATYNVLLLGFDPFQLDRNINQSNPSGASALHLHGKTVTNPGSGDSAYIQTAIFPLRYGDFNDGILENFIKPFLDGTTHVDLIITSNQGFENHFNIDRFASKYRHPDKPDNLNKRGKRGKYYTVNVDDEIKKISQSKLPEFLATELPFSDMISPDGTLANDRVVFNQGFETKDPDVVQANSLINSGIVENPVGFPPGKARKGSAGNYFSNEIFFRVAYMREVLNTIPPTITFTGHLNMPLLQNDATPVFNLALTTTLVTDVQTIIEDALDGI